MEDEVLRRTHKGTFTFRGKVYFYFNHDYNHTWKNERTVEVPIVWGIVKKHAGKKILEVGNVLSHYFPINHTVLDKYEKASGVINQDVVDFNPDEAYDLIVSISTLEHIGWAETASYPKIDQRDPQKLLRALENLKKHMVFGGQIVFTVPRDANTSMDKMIDEGKLGLTERYCLKRISEDNKWIEVPYSEVRNVKYGTPFYSANAVIVGVIKIPEESSKKLEDVHKVTLGKLPLWTVSLEEKKAFYSMAKDQKERGHILEIGSGTGGATIIFALANKERGHGEKVITIDHFEYSGLETTFKNNIRRFNVEDGIISLKGKSRDVLLKHNFPIPIRLLFIDGGHTYDESLKDLELGVPLLAKGGLLLVHDYSKLSEDVKRALVDFLKKKTHTIRFLELIRWTWIARKD